MSNSGETNIESLQRSWRKVASTHDLQTLAECTDEPRHSGGLRSKLLGAGLLCLAASMVACFFHSALVAKLLPAAAPGTALASLQQDWYYCFLLPLTLPVAYAAVTLNWFSLKLFKHNS